jgi:hypothetical protein
MALFTDGPISSIGDLQGHDTQILEVANVEGIDVTRKLVLAQEEVSVELTSLLQKVAPGTGIERVVVTSPLKLWHTYRTLEMVYRDAYHSQLNDRYAGRRDEYHEMAKWARDKAIQNGVGMAADPIPQAATPSVQTVGGGLADGTYYVGMSWTNATGEEGACSIPAVITTTGSSFEVRHGSAPANAAGWHVYVGSGPQALLRQNASVLEVGAVWTENSISIGPAAVSGQKPGYVQAIARLIERG